MQDPVVVVSYGAADTTDTTTDTGVNVGNVKAMAGRTKTYLCASFPRIMLLAMLIGAATALTLTDRGPTTGLLGSAAEHPDTNDHDATDWSNRDCTSADYLKGALVGAAVALVAVPLILCAIGLSPLGSIAGSWFALNQGAALASGGIMAMLQSLAMGGVSARFSPPRPLIAYH